jgi:lipopolysaccharide export system protein LptC
MNGRFPRLRPIGPIGRDSRSGFARRSFAEWLANLPGNRYSRRVALLKVALPATGAALLLLVAVWPRIAPLLDRMRFAAIDLKEARELRMINPRFAGTDKSNQPFVVTASIGRQVPGRNDVVALETPRADMKTHNGATIVVTANSGVYQTQSQFLDLFGNVTMVHENGTQLVTSSARIDAANNAAEGHEPVEGHGPQGDITAEGFQVVDKGDIVIFTGRSDLLLKPAHTAAPTTQPAGLHAPVAAAAAEIEAKAIAVPVRPPAPTAPVVRAHPPPQQPRPALPHAAVTPALPKPAPKKTS